MRDSHQGGRSAQAVPECCVSNAGHPHPCLLYTSDPTCGALLSHVGSNDPALGAGQSVVLPMDATPLRNAAARDLRLPVTPVSEGPQLQTSGALQIEVSGERILAPTMDLDGRSRPTSAVAIGAYEPIP